MSYQATSWVCLLPPDATTDGEFRILSQLAMFTDTRGLDCYPSLDTLLKRTGYHPRTIELALEKFQHQSWYHRPPELARRGVGPLMLLPVYLGWLRKTCGLPVHDPAQRSLFPDPAIAISDPTDQNSPASTSPPTSSPRDKSVISDLKSTYEKEEGAHAPAPDGGSHVRLLSAEERERWLEHLRAVEARVRSAPPLVSARRRPRWAARRAE